MLRDRLASAAIGLPLLLVLIGLNYSLSVRGNNESLPLLLIVVLIAGAPGWEVAHLVARRMPAVSLWNGVYAAVILPFAVHAINLGTRGGVHPPFGSPGMLIDSLGVTAAVMLLFLGLWGDVEHHGWRAAFAANAVVLLGGLYLGMAMSALLMVGLTPLREVAVLLVFFPVFALDIAAYFGGKHFKGVHLAPKISPNKTISGAICGLLAATLLAMAFAFLPSIGGKVSIPPIATKFSLLQLAAVGMGIGIFGQAGDLLESAFKRWAHTKDSGNLLPGHGGFLDRFDSLFLAALVSYFLLR